MPSNARHDDYPYIRAWGRMFASDRAFIEAEVARARADAAPPDATHRDIDGRWHTTADITRAATRIQLGLGPLRPRDPELGGITTELAQCAQSSGPLHDLYGMRLAVATSDGLIRIVFLTGWAAEVTVRLIPPGTEAAPGI
ncbi:MAG: hypothetical protein QOJ50_1905 [Cryptosporangiaceae bacterium]|jgi:hypothetical protein|nr:hypothetical protein [Cryptosporangiaceae bacterium]